MAFIQPANTADPSRAMRLAALLILFVVLSIGVWRAASLLTGAVPTPQTSAEASLYTLIDPIAGPGHSRLTLTPNMDGGQTLFILLDTRGVHAAADLQRLLPDAAGLDPRMGDKLIIEQASFARGLPGRLDTPGWLELGGLGLIALISTCMVLATLRPSSAATPVMAAREPSREREAEPERILRAVPTAMTSDVGEAARRDPAKAAAVLRSWMQNREEA